MKYIIMCGGKYETFKIPKHLLKVNGEVIVERTIRLLRKNGIEDIAISTNNPMFDYLDVPILSHYNTYRYTDKGTSGSWLDGFYPTNEPVCYILGDVYFSENAIKKIIETETDDIELFGSIPEFARNYPKSNIEAFALKVVNTDHLKEAIKETKEYAEKGLTWRKNPIIWELWTVIKNIPLEKPGKGYVYNYVKINDYTSDIDNEKDIEKLEECLKL